MVYNSYRSGQEALNYEDARNRCKELHQKADLITFKTDQHYQRLVAHGMASMAGYWIGGFDQGVWDYKKGKLVKVKSEWRWVDGTEMTYTNWGMYF